MLINVKDFLRRHGFQFHKTVDRGAIWVLGDHKVMVFRDYTHKPYELRILQDTVKKAVEKFTHQQHTKNAAFEKDVALAKLKGEQLEAQEEKEAEEAYKRRVPQTPEEHRAEQAAAGASMKDVEAEEPATQVATETQETQVKQKKSYKKLSGDERVHVFGRMRYLIEKGLDNEQISKTLRMEGVKKATGKPYSTSAIRQQRANWKNNPGSMKKIDPVEYARGEARIPRPPLPKSDLAAALNTTAALVAVAQKDPTSVLRDVKPSRKLPSYVLAILKAPADELTGDDKVRMILAWAGEA